MSKLVILLALFLHYSIIHAQNIGIGTTTPAGKLHIKGSADVSQLTIDANETQSNTNPLIRLRNSGGTDLLHIHSDNANNAFVGFNAGKVNNAEGGGIYNTFIGTAAGYSNTIGNSNTAIGAGALSSNTTGTFNIAVGPGALSHNTAGYSNTAMGYFALFNTTASYYNTAVGYLAGNSYDNGYNNVFVGADVDVNGTGYYNVIAIGRGTVVTGPSVAVFGNSSTVSYIGYTNWTSISDGRYKKNIKENVPGLDFINKLRPITYNLDATGLDAFLHKNDKNEKQPGGAAKSFYNKAMREKEKITYTGFIAQEVEAAAKELGFNFSGVDAPKNENDVYGLRYAEFVVPLVKAIQEQQGMIGVMKKRIDVLEEQNKLLQQLLNKKN